MSEATKSEEVPKSYLEADFRELSLMWEDYETKGETMLEEVTGKINHIYRCDWPSLAGPRPSEISISAIRKAAEHAEETQKIVADLHTKSDRDRVMEVRVEEIYRATVKEAIDKLADLIGEIRRLA